VTWVIEFEKLKNKAPRLRCLTGLNLAAFGDLLPAFSPAYEANLMRRDQQRTMPRQRRWGQEQKGALPRVEDKLLFILFYFRMYPGQLAQGVFFGMGQPQANAWIQRLRPILKPALGYELQLPAGEAQPIEPVLAACPGLEFIIAGTENGLSAAPKISRASSRITGASSSGLPVRTIASATSAPARLSVSAQRSRANARTSNGPITKPDASHPAAHSGKIAAFKATNPLACAPFS
jgi:Helix-turn-helix of DDE superfamily endonuclease